jgi:hypothetical protein
MADRRTATAMAARGSREPAVVTPASSSTTIRTVRSAPAAAPAPPGRRAPEGESSAGEPAVGASALSCRAAEGTRSVPASASAPTAEGGSETEPVEQWIPHSSAGATASACGRAEPTSPAATGALARRPDETSTQPVRPTLAIGPGGEEVGEHPVLRLGAGRSDHLVWRTRRPRTVALAGVQAPTARGRGSP